MALYVRAQIIIALRYLFNFSGKSLFRECVRSSSHSLSASDCWSYSAEPVLVAVAVYFWKEYRQFWEVVGREPLSSAVEVFVSLVLFTYNTQITSLGQWASAERCTGVRCQVPSIFGITSSQLITQILPYRRRWTMPTCAQCSKFLPKTGLCFGCGLDNNRRMINPTTATSASVFQPNTNYSARMSHIPDDLSNINAALSDIRGQLHCLSDIKQSLSKLDDITATLRDCMGRVENLQRSFHDVSQRVDGLSSAPTSTIDAM